MSDSSPNSFKPVPDVKKSSKTPLIIIGIALLLMFGVLYYSINNSNVKQEDVGKEANITEEEEPIWLVDGSGLTLDKDKEQASGVIPPPAPPVADKPEKPIEPIIVVRDNQNNNEELQHVRRTRTQAYISALKAPMLAKRVNTPEQRGQVQHVATRDVSKEQTRDQVMNDYMQQLNGQKGSNYDPRADEDKEAFFARSQKHDNAWISNDVRTKGQKYELKTGMVIPAAMITGINSDLPGNIIAQVTQNVFDASTGQNLLVPQGSKLFGVYDSRVIYGQSRVLVAWNRIVFPDGSAVTLPSMPGTDMSGSGGFEDEVDNHYFRIFGSAILMSLIVGGTAYAMDTATGGDTDEYSLQSQMTASMAQQLGQTTTRLLEANISIKPTLEIRQGYQFNIVLTKDIVFDEPYRAWN